MLSFRRFTEEENMKKQVLSLVGVPSLLMVAGSALARTFDCGKCAVQLQRESHNDAGR